MKERSRELKAARDKADGESDVLAKIAEMQKADRVIAERISCEPGFARRWVPRAVFAGICASGVLPGLPALSRRVRLSPGAGD